jgi:SAM-dependent methyltransferase
MMSARSFTAAPEADLSLDAVHYGPDIPTEADLRLLGPTNGNRFLELGCAGGHASVALAKQGARVIAIDESSEQIGHARRLADREEVKVELHQGDLAELAFVRADTIDAALSVYTLGTVADLDRVFRQVHRVLRPEAPFVISLPHPVFRTLDAEADPPVIQRSYFDRAPVKWNIEGEKGSDYPVTIAELFTSLTRANFRVDTLLEPQPRRRGHTSWVPSTLIVRARKHGT